MGKRHFNPRAPCGARPTISGQDKALGLFQSTRPVRGATALPTRKEAQQNISIHAPRAGRDYFKGEVILRHVEFQSTRPVRGATTAHVAG